MPLPRYACLAILSAILIGRVLAVPTLVNRAPPGDPNPPDLSLRAAIPEDLEYAETGDLDKDRAAFNDFSWWDFIALNWTALEGTRGKPDTDKPFGAQASNVVWGSWKSVGELFPPDPAVHAPSAWESFDAMIAAEWQDKDGKLKSTQFNDLPTEDAGRQKVLSGLTGLKNIGEFGIEGKRLGPLVAQNGTYIRYEIRVNKIAYEFIWKEKYYLKANLPNDPANGPIDKNRRIPFPCGSMIVKAAWMELTDRDDRKRFYTMPSKLVDSQKGAPAVLRDTTMGLVGLHIVHKTPTRPSWVWSTFEHVDNTEPGPCAARASFSRNDPTTPNDGGFDYMPFPIQIGTPPPLYPRPVDVYRITRIHSTTMAINQRYHKLRAIRDTIWKNYNLVATQWVPKPDLGNPGARALPNSHVANATIETYIQTSSCLECHGGTQDFRFIFFPSVMAVGPSKKQP
jgi:hypothetical protein